MSRDDLNEVQRRPWKGLLPIDVVNALRSRRSEQNRSMTGGKFWRIRHRMPWRDFPLTDKGYCADAIGLDLASRNIREVISGGSDRRVTIDHARGLRKQFAISFRSMVRTAAHGYSLKIAHIA